MSLKADLKVDLAEAEGRRTRVYIDTLGYATVGIGHRVTPTDNLSEGDVIEDEKIEHLFDIDYMRAMSSVQRHFPEFETWPRLAQLAVLNWIWQLGTHAPEKFPRATKALQSKRWSEAAAEWEFANVRTRRHSKWFQQTTHRCLQEVKRLKYVADFVEHP